MRLNVDPTATAPPCTRASRVLPCVRGTMACAPSAVARAEAALVVALAAAVAAAA